MSSNKQCHNEITKKEVQAVHELVHQATVSAAGMSRTVERSRYLKPRPGCGKMAKLIGQIAQRKGLKGEMPVAEMLQRLDEVERLAPLVESVQSLVRGLSDAAFYAESTAWSAALAYYSALQGMSRLDPQVEQSLEPVAEFLSIGRRKSDKPEENVAADETTLRAVS